MGIIGNVVDLVKAQLAWGEPSGSPSRRELAAAVGGGPPGLSINRTNEALTREYVNSIYLWRCVDMIASMAASVPLIVKKENDETQLTAPEREVERLLKRPNPQWSGHALQYYVAASIAVANKAYLLRVRGAGAVTQELWPLATTDVMPVFEIGSRMLKQYLVNVNGRQVPYDVDPDTGESDVIAIWRPALNEQTDKSPAAIAAAPGEVFTRILQRCADIVSNSSNITGMLSTDSELFKGEVEKIKERLNDFKIGADQSGGVLVTANAKWTLTRLSESPTTALSVEIKDSLARDVSMTFGVPSQLMGLPGTDTYNNLAQARVGFLTDTVLPTYIGLYVAGLNHALMQNGARIVPDIEQIPAMVAYRHDMVDTAVKANMLSINEQRELLGYKPFKSDDDEYADADVPVKLEELRLKRLAIEAQMGGAPSGGGGIPNPIGRLPADSTPRETVQ